jgi:hypothetical protein
MAPTAETGKCPGPANHPDQQNYEQHAQDDVLERLRKWKKRPNPISDSNDHAKDQNVDEQRHDVSPFLTEFDGNALLPIVEFGFDPV